MHVGERLIQTDGHVPLSSRLHCFEAEACDRHTKSRPGFPCLSLLVNGIGEDVGMTVIMGKVIRPLRSVDPSQTEYQGLIEVTEEGWCQVMMWLTELTFKVHCFLG